MGVKLWASRARGREMGVLLGEWFPWKSPFFEGEGKGTVHFSNGGAVSSEAPILWTGCCGRVHCRKGLP